MDFQMAQSDSIEILLFNGETRVEPPGPEREAQFKRAYYMYAKPMGSRGSFCLPKRTVNPATLVAFCELNSKDIGWVNGADLEYLKQRGEWPAHQTLVLGAGLR
jgi:hypothetical protein